MKFLPAAAPVADRNPADLFLRVSSHVLDVTLQAALQIASLTILSRPQVSDALASLLAQPDSQGVVDSLTALFSLRSAAAVIVAWLVGGMIEVYLTVVFGGSPGKLLVGIEVVDVRTGRRPSPRQAFLRWLGLGWAAPTGVVAPLVQVVPLAGYGLAWFDPQRRCLHDRLSGLAVVSKSSRA